MTSCRKTSDTALALFSFNRPGYLAEVLRSLEGNAGLDGLDCYFFQDGAVNKFSRRVAANSADIDQCLELWQQCRLPNKQLIRQDFNVGIGISQFLAKELLFGEMGYDQAMFFEDDLVLNKNYLRSLRLMLRQFQTEPVVGTVTCHGGPPGKFSDGEKLKYLSRVRATDDHLWGWATWQDRWQKIKPAFLEYYRFIKNIDYQRRPEQAIMALYKKNGINLKVSSQDAAMHYALAKNHLVPLGTLVHRARYIGARGEHMTPERFDRMGYSKMTLLHIEEDAQIQKFDGYDEKAALAYRESRFILKP